MGDHATDRDWLELHHRCKRPERLLMLKDIAVPDGARILDVGSGCGVWSREFMAVGENNVFCIDLELSSMNGNPGRCVAADAQSLPFASYSFDLVWCANTLMYVSDPLAALVEFVRCIKPGGVVVVKEEDSGRDILLPWPEELDVSIRGAWLKITADSPAQLGDAYIGRKMRQIMTAAGLSEVTVRTYSMDRVYPFSVDTIDYVTNAYLAYVTQYEARLSKQASQAMRLYLDSSYGGSIWNDPGAHLVMIETVVMARVDH